ncbi:MAG: HDIG domain-containing protein [Anaerolineales bacterium]|jgi:putative nucleotidyltransferase with HDIG domain|nr:HDIG domain-containing protein [Anaerolineales bacterium]
MSEKAILQRKAPRWSTRRRVFLGTLWAVCLLISIAALVMPFSTRPASLRAQVGDVTSQDIVAPRTLNYQSAVFTERDRREAADAVAPVYGAPDANVARQQLEHLRAAVDFIDSVRADGYATLEQKIGDLTALQNVNLGRESAQAILLLNDSAWQNVRQEAIVVLEQIMRSSIRQSRLDEARRSIPALVSLSLPQDQATLVAEIVAAFVAPNSFYSEALTQVARDEASAAVPPAVRTFVTNEIVVARGQVINEADLEALQQFGLVQPETGWQNYVGAAALALAAFALAGLFLRFRPQLLDKIRELTLVATLFVAFLLVARFVIVDRTVLPYLFPVAGFGLLAATLYSSQAAMVFSLVLSVLAAYNLPNAFDLTLFYFFGSLFGILFLKRAQRVMAYFWAGAAVVVAGAAILIAYRLPLASTDALGILTLLGAAALNGFLAASLTIVLQLFLAQWLGLTTTVQLMELARPDHPLLQLVMRQAPGTYQHSLLIANLAEQAAEAIGADALLTRIGSLYHDAGKARQPHYFIENQVTGAPNPHEQLSPTESAAHIIRHVPDGVELARKHRLPNRIIDFIKEHHGTLVTRFQYVRAVEAAGGDESQVNLDDFRYDGPRPQSRETALVMLADGCEARTRAERPKTQEALEALVKSVIDNRLNNGQLDDTTLTMYDLKVIAETFVTGLRGVYHPRLVYPDLDEKTINALDAQPSLKSLPPKQ